MRIKRSIKRRTIGRDLVTVLKKGLSLERQSSDQARIVASLYEIDQPGHWLLVPHQLCGTQSGRRFPGHRVSGEQGTSPVLHDPVVLAQATL